MILGTNNHKIIYLALLDTVQSPGVYRKILGTVAGAEQTGYSSGIVILDSKPGFLEKFVWEIDNSDGEVLIIRSLCQYNFYLIPALYRAKKRGKKVIMDVPTPNAVAVRELADSDTPWKSKVKNIASLILSGPIPFWYVSKILQYSEEGSWFSFGNRRRTSFIGNGIHVSSIPVRTQAPVFDGSCLYLICVATLNYWHGVDRLIKAISIFNSEESYLKVHLKIVGKGAVLADLVDLADALVINEYISFLGFREGERLFSEYKTAHLAVGSLALFRKNLKSASELKSREYCAVGIPFIGVGEDPDFPQGTGFRIQLPNRENVDDLTNFFRNFNSDCLSFTPKEIRDYAWKNLDFSVKIKEVLKGVEE